MKTLVHFLNAILHLDGKRRFVYATPVRPTINLSSSDKKQKIVRFDVHARTKDGHFIDVEMNVQVTKIFSIVLTCIPRY